MLLMTGILATSGLWSQDKFEKERRIKRKDVPSEALKFLDSLHIKSRVKWFQEEGLIDKSIEAKFKRNKIRYSVEFDSTGRIEDIEMELPWRHVELSVRNRISSQLEQNCTKHKIVKVQRQFSGKASDLLTWMQTSTSTKLLTINYEIIVKCSQQKHVDLYEYLFNAHGETLSVSKIVFKNSSHLEY